MKQEKTKRAYPLSKVRELIKGDKVRVKAKPALEKAKEHFGWGKTEALTFINSLNPKFFHKSAPHDFIDGLMVDTYKVRGYKKQYNVYTHFHIIEDVLVIVSLKDIDKDN